MLFSAASFSCLRCCAQHIFFAFEMRRTAVSNSQHITYRNLLVDTITLLCVNLFIYVVTCDFFSHPTKKKYASSGSEKEKRRVRIANKPRQSELEMIRRSIYRRDVKPEHKHLRSRIKLERVHSSIESTNPRQSLQWSSLTSRKTEKKTYKSIDRL